MAQSVSNVYDLPRHWFGTLACATTYGLSIFQENRRYPRETPPRDSNGMLIAKRESEQEG